MRGNSCAVSAVVQFLSSELLPFERMPSASAKLEKQASQEALDPLKQVLIMIEHKKRNLEKRKTKLESYREEQKSGKEIKGEKLAAVMKYDEVCTTLEFAVDMAKQVQSISTDHAKLLKKQQRKEQLERTQNDLGRFRDLLTIQDVMLNMGNEYVRADFLAGKDGAAKVTQEELSRLDELYQLLSPKREEGIMFQQQVASAAEHFISLVEGRSKELLGTNYAALNEVLHRINSCGYFEKNLQKLNPEFVPGQEPVVEETLEAAVREPSPINEIVETLPHPSAIPPQSTTPTPQQPAPAQGPTPEISYFTAPVEQGAPSQFPPNMVQPIPTVNNLPVQHRQQQQQQQQPRPISEVIGQGQSSFNFLQESQIEMESPQPAGVDIAAMLQFQPSGVPPAAGLPLGRNPAAPAASAVPQPDFHQAIPTQTFTNQNFPVMAPQNVVPPVSAPSSAPTQAPAAHIPPFSQQQPPIPANFLPTGAPNQDITTPMPLPARVQEEQIKMIIQSQAQVVPSAPASFAQAATLKSQAQPKPQNFNTGAPPGFGPQKMQQQQQQQQLSQFQPIPSLEQAAEQEESNTWNNEAGEGQDQGNRSGYRSRGGRGGRGRQSNSNGYSSGRPRGGSGQQNGGRSGGGYQSRGNQDWSERGGGYENGVSSQQREYGSNYKRSGPPRESSGNSSRGQGYRGNRDGNGPYRGGAPNSGNRTRGGGGGGSSGGGQNQRPRAQDVKQ